jgi:hypothetical protein
MFKKKPTEDNNQTGLIFIKIWTLLVVLKSCLLLCNDGRKQIFDINLIGAILMRVYEIRDPILITNMRQI